MRHGKVGLQLGAHQKYYISRCEEKSSIMVTITMPARDDVKSGEERRELINDITRLLNGIMKVFMPAVKKMPIPLLSCPNCPTLHITLEEVCSGSTIFCPKSGDADVPPFDLLPSGHHRIVSGEVVILSLIILIVTVLQKPKKGWKYLLTIMISYL